MKGSTTHISVRDFLICTVLALVVAFTGSAVLYMGSSKALRCSTRVHLKSLASTAASMVDPDLHRTIRTRSDESSAAYRNIKAVLCRIRHANPDIRFIYTMRPTNSRKWQFIVDAEQDPAQMSHVGDEYDTSKYPEMQKGLIGPAADHGPSADKWGTWLSGYAPIRDSKGHVEAIIGLDMSLAELQKEERSVRVAAARNAVISLIISILLSLIVMRVFLKPLQTLTKAVRRVADGDLEFQAKVGGIGGIGEFGRSFDDMIVDLRESRERLLSQVISDPLTGLANHRHFHDVLSREIDRAKRQSTHLCVAFLDVDRFKCINDTLGHPIGDSILVQLADVFRRNLRSVDVCSRYGGDEFAFIFPDTNGNAGLEVAERLRAAVEAEQFHTVFPESLESGAPVALTEKSIHVTVTAGIAVFPEHSGSHEGLVMAADIALSRAKHRSRNSVQQYEPSIASERKLDLRDLYESIHDRKVSTVRSLASAGNAMNRYTFGHAERVAGYAMQIGKSMELSDEVVGMLKVAGLLHDVGKLEIPESVIKKIGSLTTAERDSMRMHPGLGADMLESICHLKEIAPVVRYHHERFDGAGYPDGLSGIEIPLMARILAVSDAYDAMTSDRPYRRAMAAEAALLELRAGAGSQFDPEVVDAFARILACPCEEAA